MEQAVHIISRGRDYIRIIMGNYFFLWNIALLLSLLLVTVYDSVQMFQIVFCFIIIVFHFYGNPSWLGFAVVG